MTPSALDAAEVARISAIEDPAMRNLWITQAYSELAARLRALVDDRDLTWCGFAVWASATAGQSIRREELPAEVVRLLDRSARHHDELARANHRLRWLRGRQLDTDDVLAAIDEALDATSAHIGHGNRLVFAELAPLFVAFIELLEGGGPHDVDEGRVDGTLRSIDPAVDDGVLEAFRWYFRASTTIDDVARARCVLAGNVLAVAHEQRRLQDDVDAAMAAGVDSIERLLDRVAGRPGGWRWRIAEWIVKPVVVHAWDVAITALMMTLRVPGTALRLDADVPPGPAGQLWPADLADLTDPVEPAQPAEVYAGWDRTGGSGRHDRAGDWGLLGDRMNFIVNLFRSRQQVASLVAAPFSDEQLAEMRAGRMPGPPLLPPLEPAPAAG